MAKVRKIGDRWVADFRDASGKRHREYRKTKKAAEDLLAQRQVSVQKGTYSAEGRTARFEALARDWLRVMGPEWRPTTATQSAYIVESHLLNPGYGLGARRVATIGLQTCEDFKLAMMAANPNLSPRTVNLALQKLGTILRYGQARGLLYVDPTQHVRRIKGAPRIVKPLTADERGKLLAAATAEGPAAHLIVNLGLRAALRLGETLALTWGAFDPEARTLTIRGTNSCKAYREAFAAQGAWPSTKTEESARRVPLSPELVAELQRFRLIEGRPPAGALLFSKDGIPLDPSSFRARPWRRLLAAAGLPAGTHYHDLRHTCLSELIAAGISPEWVRLLAGHRSLNVTLTVYRHFLPRDVDTAEAIDRALAAGSGQ